MFTFDSMLFSNSKLKSINNIYKPVPKTVSFRACVIGQEKEATAFFDLSPINHCGEIYPNAAHEDLLL